MTCSFLSKHWQWDRLRRSFTRPLAMRNSSHFPTMETHHVIALTLHYKHCKHYTTTWHQQYPHHLLMLFSLLIAVRSMPATPCSTAQNASGVSTPTRPRCT